MSAVKNQNVWYHDLNKGKSAIIPLFDDPKVLPSVAPDKVKLFFQIFSENSYLDGSDISLPAFHLS